MTIYLEEMEVEISVRRSNRARRISLKACPGRGFELVVPPSARHREAHAFIARHRDWIVKHKERARTREGIDIEQARHLPIFGGNYEIVKECGNILRIDDERNVIYAPLVTNKRLLTDILLEFAHRAIDEYAAKIGRRPARVAVRPTTSRWGSCSAKGNISLSLYLVFSPENIIRYVIAHEMSHLVHMNHSAEFWRVVEGLYPQYKNARKWLRENGGKLQNIVQK